MDAFEHVKTGASLGRSLLHYHARLSPRPISASFAVTNRCNLRCSYCNFPLLDPAELSLEKIQILFSSLAAMGVVRLGLVGGEPLLRDDLPHIAAAAKKHGFFVSLNTNLTLTSRFPERMPKVDLVFTSLDGSPATHKKNRGEHSLDHVMESIVRLRSAGTPVVAITVLTDANLREVPTLLELAREYDFKLHFQAQCTDTEIVRGSLADFYRQPNKIWQTLLEAKKKGAPIASSVGYLEHLSKWDDFGAIARHNPNSRCAAGYGFLFIDPQGYGFPCAYTKGKTPGINLVTENWAEQFPRKTPCTQCAVGPMTEFNLLYESPFRSIANMISGYGIGT